MGARDLPEKLVKTGGTPFWALFGHFGPKWPKPVNSWSPLGVQGIEEKRNLPWGVSSEATRRVYLCTGDTVRAK